MKKITPWLTLVAALATLGLLTGCGAGEEGTVEDKQTLDRLSQEGMSPPPEGGSTTPGQPGAPGSGQSMNPPPEGYTGE